ncbi:Rhodanese-related sulfurtransferase [hydrothermal vent metagenome]|uniref:Rhodanese-related sulfurtransferase n=1 Tax=hydrothermal vent metagenome TaxID=652676 RepID=A0A1W1BSE7_9ZZZZ
MKSLQDFVKEAKSRIKEVDVNQAQIMINDGYKVLDVREPGEFISGTIENALNIPRGILEAASDLQYPGANPAIRDCRNDKWLVLCRTGGRAAMATDVLQQMGFTNVVNIIGGMEAWNQANLPSVSQTI